MEKWKNGKMEKWGQMGSGPTFQHLSKNLFLLKAILKLPILNSHLNLADSHPIHHPRQKLPTDIRRRKKGSGLTFQHLSKILTYSNLYNPTKLVLTFREKALDIHSSAYF